MVDQGMVWLMSQGKGLSGEDSINGDIYLEQNSPHSRGSADSKHPLAACTLATEEAMRNLISEHFDFDATGYEVSIPLPWLRAEQILLRDIKS